EIVIRCTRTSSTESVTQCGNRNHPGRFSRSFLIAKTPQTKRHKKKGRLRMTYIRYLTLAATALCLLANDALAQTAPRAPQQTPRAPQQTPGAAPQQTSPAPQQTPANALPGADDVWTIPDRDRINEGTVTVITAPVGGATAMFGSDLARVLDDDATVRVLPVLGKGPVRNVVDILYLKSIDMGAVAADVPEFYKLQYKIPDIQSRLRYIAKLYHNELHIVAPKSIKSIFDLDGK